MSNQGKGKGIFGIVFFVGGFLVIMGLFKGCITKIAGGSFSDGFFEDTGIVFVLIIAIAFFTLMGILFGNNHDGDKN
jgi:hypothetical protein